MRRAGISHGLILGLCGSIGACAGSLPQTHYYTLGVPREVVGETSGGGADESLVVGVETFTVDPPYDQDRLVYRLGRDSSEVGFYAYHRWASPLGRLVSVAIAEGLRGTPGVTSIEPAASTGDYSARLAGRVIYLEEVDLPDGQEARIAVELELRDRNDETLWSQTVVGTATGRADSGSQIALQINRAFEALLEQARRDLAGALR